MTAFFGDPKTRVYRPLLTVADVDDTLGKTPIRVAEAEAKERDLQTSCKKDVRDAMKKAWSQAGNGTTGAEAGFRLDGKPESYSLVPSSYTNELGSQTMRIVPDRTFAIFHVHPQNSGPQPSTPSTSANHFGDTGIADKYAINVYVMSASGLWVYDHELHMSIKLQNGLDWTKPCP
jgi:hypothetical protein